MKLFQQLLVAPAALGLLAPMAANAAELNTKGVSNYTASNSEVESISQFSDVYPTDWAFTALVDLAEKHGCKIASPAGSMTRYEAAAILNTCLEDVAQVNNEERRLLNEFAPELATIKGRLDGIEADIGGIEAGGFSSTTKMAGTTRFVMGAVEGLNNEEAFHMNYDTVLALNTSFTGEDLLKTTIRAGNFSSATPFSGSAALESAFDSSSDLEIHRNYYKFPVSDSLTATIGAVVRQDDMLGVWPSSYPSDSILDVLTYAGANAAYNLSTGAGAGITYAGENINASLVYVGDSTTSSDSSSGILTDEGSDDFTAQVAWIGDGFTLAAAYTNSDGGNTTGDADAQDFDAWGISAVWDTNLDSEFIPSSISAGFGWKNLDEENDVLNIEDESTWSIGLLWDDLFIEGNTLGMAIGSAEGWRDDSGYDDPFAFEIYYSMAVSDNITITPAIFQVERNDADDITGGLVKTTFSF